MSFEIDHETYSDLEIFNDRSGRSVFSVFDRTRTEGGKQLLYRIMQNPSSDYHFLLQRRDAINFFYQHKLELDITYHQMDMVDCYLAFNKRCLDDNFIDAVYDHYSDKINSTNDYYIIITGIKQLLKLLKFASAFVTKLQALNPPDHLKARFEAVNKLLSNRKIQKLLVSDGKISCFAINYLDNLFRKLEIQTARDIIGFIYEADVLQSLAEVLNERDWCLPEYRSDKVNELQIHGLVHPSLKSPVDNDTTIDTETTVVFVTGPNMAGKSSFLKAIGLAVYLAHLGFPVPAKSMKTPIFKGLVTTINPSDNISEGLSHYYSEIKRIKKTASRLLENGSLFVIFDELFRGTNLKDAFEATLLVTATLNKIKSSKFIISSHFTEITGDLKKLPGISFNYFDCTFVDEKPKFDYKLKNGVSEERLGMYILQNEGVISVLEQAISKEG